MTGRGFISLSGNVIRVMALAILGVLMFMINLVFKAVKFSLIVVLIMLTLGKFGTSTMDLGGKLSLIHI